MATNMNVEEMRVTDQEFSLEFAQAMALVGNKGKLVTVYFPYSHTVEEVGLYFSDKICLVADWLPVTGYGNSYYYPEDINKKVVILRNKVYSYKESRFLDCERSYELLNLQDGTVHDVFVHIVPNGISGTKYQIDFENSVAYYYNGDYGKEFVILNSEESLL